MVRLVGGAASLIALMAFTWPSGDESHVRRPASVQLQPVAAAEAVKPAAPVLRGVGVKKIVASDAPVALPVQGQGFVPGLTANLSSLTEIVAFGPSSISNVTPAGFTLTAPFSRVGTYELAIRTPDGRKSNALTINVVAR